MQIAVFAKECHARARANMRLFSTIICTIADENGWKILPAQSRYKRFYYPAVSVGKALTINNLYIYLRHCS